MARTEVSGWTIGVTVVAFVVTGCGGTTTDTGTHLDVGDAAAGGSRNGTGGAGTSSGGSGGSSLVACDDGSGNTDCCPLSAVDGGPCDVSIQRCSRGGCHDGFMSYLYCGADGIWIAGHGLIPCSVDAGPDGSVSQMSCSDLHTAWTSFWESHAPCTTDADCTTFLVIDPSLSPCDAPPGLNRALNKQFVGEAQLYANRYVQLACGGDTVTRPNARNGLWSDFGYDGTALVNPRCASGLCSADSLQCNPNPPFDGGSGDASRTSCPGTAGPTMVRVPAPDGTTYCIDSTEVTNAQYAMFVGATNAGTETSGQDARCSWNTTYTPSGGWPATGKDDYPVVFVDWCDAFAYCKWAGKRLCGKIGGGANEFVLPETFANAMQSEWYNACSQGGALAYPYGNTYDGTACVGSDYDGVRGYESGSDFAHPVRSIARCHGVAPPYDGIYDLSGNVYEWEDSCRANGATGQQDDCSERGGSFVGGYADLVCSPAGINSRGTSDSSFGFRCCAE